jgi:hypothetical protein
MTGVGARRAAGPGHQTGKRAGRRGTVSDIGRMDAGKAVATQVRGDCGL